MATNLSEIIKNKKRERDDYGHAWKILQDCTIPDDLPIISFIYRTYTRAGKQKRKERSSDHVMRCWHHRDDLIRFQCTHRGPAYVSKNVIAAERYFNPLTVHFVRADIFAREIADRWDSSDNLARFRVIAGLRVRYWSSLISVCNDNHGCGDIRALFPWSIEIRRRASGKRLDKRFSSRAAVDDVIQRSPRIRPIIVPQEIASAWNIVEFPGKWITESL